MSHDPSPPRPPRSEPEIIPPGARTERERDRVVFVEMRSGQALPLFRPSLFTLLLIVGLVGLAALALLVLVLGAFLISLPVIGLVFAALLIGSLLRAQAARRR